MIYNVKIIVYEFFQDRSHIYFNIIYYANHICEIDFRNLSRDNR